MPDEIQPDEIGAQPVQLQEPKSRRAFSRLKLELTDEELSSPGVPKMLVDLLTQAEQENSDLRPYREKYYEADKQRATLQERLKTRVAIEVVSLGTLAIGGLALGYVHDAWTSQPDGYIALVVGVVLIIVGIGAKVIRP
jgi:hypothetical protein